MLKVTLRSLLAHLGRMVLSGLAIMLSVAFVAGTLMLTDTGSTSTIRNYLLGFAGLSVLVGVFLIVNTFSVLIAQRTREFGLLRALGASRRQLRRSVLVEAFVLGLTGSTAGLAAGVGIAAALKDGPLVVRPTVPLAAYLVGTGVTVLAGYLPARRAGRVSPMAAMREAHLAPRQAYRLRGIVGGALLACGCAALLGSGPLVAFGVFASLLGVIVGGPALVGLLVPPLAGVLPLLFGAVGRLSRQNALRNTRRTAATATALTVGVAMVGLISVYAASAADSVDARVDRMLGADFVIRAASDGSLISKGTGDRTFGPEMVDLARRVDGVGTVLPEIESPVRITANGRSYNLHVYGDDPGFPAMLKHDYIAGDARQALATGKVIIGADLARESGVTVGGTVELQASGGPATTLTVGAIQEVEPSGGSLNRYRGAPTVGIDVLRTIAHQAALTTVFVTSAGDPAKVYPALRAAFAGNPRLLVEDHAAYKQRARADLDSVLALVYALLGLTILVASLGVVNTLALSVLERTREIGLLRAIGASRAQIRQLIRLESLTIAVYGTLIGLALGLSWGIAVQRRQATFPVLTVPWPTVLAVVAGAGVVGLLAALAPAHRAARMNILTASRSQ
ncbi:ABC transporter permease [Dactylosporangium sp. CA-233914]|uniref:ABC transporter permease n=1 Tax=Dactylosporangium sp. CA-233914 TaxID=3239934 RepID=UPI003D92AED7